MILVGLEIIMFLATILFAILWIWNQAGGNYEPWTVICGAVAAAIELFRGFQKRSKNKTKPESTFTDNTSDSLSKTTVTQTHSGTGDNVGGSQTNIGRQIIMGPNSTYNETNTKD